MYVWVSSNNDCAVIAGMRIEDRKQCALRLQKQHHESKGTNSYQLFRTVFFKGVRMKSAENKLLRMK